MITEPTASVTVVEYRVRPDAAQENTDLVRDVYAELATRDDAGFRYVTTVLDDGVSFVHVAVVEPGHEAPLPQIVAFERFRAGLRERCEVPPVARTGAVVGRQGL